MLAIAGGKGGCGKTTTTLGLATASPERTVAVDLDRGMPDLHALADVDREPTVAAVDRSERPAAAAQPVPERDGVEVLAAPRTDVDRTDVNRAVMRLQSVDSRVLLDSPAGATEAAALPLRLADRTLLVSALCAPALRDTAKTAAMARAFDAPPVGAVLTRTRLAPGSIEELLGCPVLASVPAVEPPVLESAVVRAAYRRLADSIQGGDAV
jgi:septum site-determining protein MinD